MEEANTVEKSASPDGPISLAGYFDDLDGSRRRYQWMRRAYRPFVDQYVALSGDLAGYLRQRVGVPERRVVQIYNGVDIQRFHPADGGRAALPGGRRR